MKPVLAVDLDDVLFPFMDRFVPHYNDKFDATFVMDDYHTFEFHEVWGGTNEEAFDCVRTFFHMSHDGVPPLSGSVEAIAQLSEMYDLIIVTARDESLRSHTEGWLHEVFPGHFQSVFLCNSYLLNAEEKRRTKLDVIEDVDAVGIIDDSLRNTSQVAATGRRAMLFGNYAWNRTDNLPEGVKRYRDWPHIVESLVTAA
jgi:5'(3')-deoxyribonucleotidase